MTVQFNPNAAKEAEAARKAQEARLNATRVGTSRDYGHGNAETQANIFFEGNDDNSVIISDRNGCTDKGYGAQVGTNGREAEILEVRDRGVAGMAGRETVMKLEDGTISHVYKEWGNTVIINELTDGTVQMTKYDQNTGEQLVQQKLDPANQPYVKLVNQPKEEPKEPAAPAANSLAPTTSDSSSLLNGPLFNTNSPLALDPAQYPMLSGMQSPAPNPFLTSGFRL